MIRTWTTVGEGVAPLAEYETAIDAIDWRDLNGSWPALPGLALECAIRELRIPKVTRAGISTHVISIPDPDGDGTETAAYAVYGIEGRYTNGRALVYLLDRGSILTPIASDFWPLEAVTA